MEVKESKINSIERKLDKLTQAINYLAGVLENVVEQQRIIGKQIQKIELAQKKQTTEIAYLKSVEQGNSIALGKIAGTLPELRELSEELRYRLYYGEKATQIKIIEQRIFELRAKNRQHPEDQTIRTELVNLQKLRDEYIYQ